MILDFKYWLTEMERVASPKITLSKSPTQTRSLTRRIPRSSNTNTLKSRFNGLNIFGQTPLAKPKKSEQNQSFF